MINMEYFLLILLSISVTGIIELLWCSRWSVPRNVFAWRFLSICQLVGTLVCLDTTLLHCHNSYL